jgi:cell division protein FtsW
MRKKQENLFTADGINKCDKIMLSCAFFLFMTGIVFVFAADSSDILSRGKGVMQIVWSTLGLTVAAFFLLIDYKRLANEKVLTFILTVLTVMLGILASCSIINYFGHEVRIENSGFGIRRINGAYRWIDMKIFNFQPSIFAKVFLILFIAAVLSKIPENKNKKNKKEQFPEKNKFAARNKKEQPEHTSILKKAYNHYKHLWFSLLIFVLVLIQPSTSVAFSIVFVALSILMLKNSRHIFGRNFFIIVTVLLVAGVVAWNAFPHIRTRISKGGDNFQSRQAVLTIGSGGWGGLWLGRSEAKYARLPEIENDYIFSLIAEETGFIGAFIFIGIYVLFVTRGFFTAIRAENNFGRLLAFGITVNYALAFLIHLFVNLGFVSTGASLPFVSYGGTAIIADSIMLGILLNISGLRYERFRV